MPHLIVEYSGNLAATHDLQAFADLLREEAVATGIFPLAGIRVRLYPSKIYSIADGHEDNCFVSILLRIGQGRELDTKKQAGQRIFDAACRFFSDIADGGHFMLSLDIQENEAAVSFKANSVRNRLQGGS